MKDRDFSGERHQKIVDYINLKGHVTVEELAERFDVTETTIRRDLISLEKGELLYRAHGGAIKRETVSIWQLSTLQMRMRQHTEEKKRIALCVSGMIHNGESLMIDGGSTTTLIAQELRGKRNLLIVTNALAIGELLAESRDHKIILTGGELLQETNALMGTAAEAAISSYRTDKTILGVSGLIPGEGCFSAIPQEGAIKDLMLRNSRQNIIVSDSSKIGLRAFYLFCDSNKIDILVTDKNIKKNDLATLKKKGVEVILV